MYMHLLVFLSQTLRYRIQKYLCRRRPYGQVGVQCRLIPGSTVAKLLVGLAW
jgi:hypothetical protein